MATLSVVIMAYNEEEKITQCLQSIKDIADEIIFVDNSSTDKTKILAEKYTKKIFTQKNDPQHIDIQKNFGFEKATKDWILSLDADEQVPKELAEEIKKIIAQEREANAYWIPRKNIIFGKWIEHTGWYPDLQLRLFKNGKGKYMSSHVHEHLSVEGQIGELFHPLSHYNYETVSQFLTKSFLVYAPNEAQALVDSGYAFSYLDSLRFPIREFLSRYFAREGYKDGLHGLMLSLLMAAYHLAVFAYVWEKKKFIDEAELYSLKHIHNEAEKLGGELHHWFIQERLKDEKNILKKIFLKGSKRL